MKNRRIILVSIVCILFLHGANTINASRLSCDQEYDQNQSQTDANYDACKISLGVMAPTYCYIEWGASSYNNEVEWSVCKIMYEME
jgi:hypothetical protein